MSASKEQKIPGPDHPITVTPTDGHVVARAGDQVIAESDRALTLQEANYPAVQYVPLADVDQAILRATEHQTYCPYKGEASYYSLVLDGETKENAVWTYEQPYPAVAAIAGHLAFYPDRVDAVEELPAA